jgi:soluble lytic murein transglycosylase
MSPFSKVACLALLLLAEVGWATPEAATNASAETARSVQTTTPEPGATPRVEQSVGNETSGSWNSVGRSSEPAPELQSLARNLLENRTPDAYAAVEAYIKTHEGTNAAALGWFATANARLLDNDYAKALEALDNVRFDNSLLEDYVTYQRAQSFSGLGSADQIVNVLKDFPNRFPDSLLKADATLLYANSLLSSERVIDAIDVLTAGRAQGRADLDLALGRAYAKAGDIRNAVSVFQQIIYRSPLTAEADLAASELKALESSGKLPDVPFSDRRARAEALLRGARWHLAVQELRDLEALAPGREKARLDLQLAYALARAGQREPARVLLERLRPLSAEQGAERAYRMLEIARGEGNDRGFQQRLRELRTSHSRSQWLDRALVSAANLSLLNQDYASAIARFTELSTRFPSSPRASYASWRASWLIFRQGRLPEAKAAFERHVRTYPSSSDVPAALYWRARIAEDEKQLDTARAWYSKLSTRYVNHYYGQQARVRLGKIGLGGKLPRIELLEGLPRASSDSVGWRSSDEDVQNMRYLKSKALENAGLFAFAVNEMRALAEPARSSWVDIEIARLYQETGQYHRALWTLRAMVPSYFSIPLASLPEPVRAGLFPRPYWDEVCAYSAENGIDPVLTVALIRQESEFNPGAVSSANAVGLMQLLPSTASPIARTSGMADFSSQTLIEPGTNIRLGTRHFGDLLKRFGGRPEYALAAYNAGSDRVKQWLAAGTYRDVPEFVEAIPFSETREYVKAIVRNVDIYRSLYADTSNGRSSGGD